MLLTLYKHLTPYLLILICKTGVREWAEGYSEEERDLTRQGPWAVPFPPSLASALWDHPRGERRGEEDATAWARCCLSAQGLNPPGHGKLENQDHPSSGPRSSSLGVVWAAPFPFLGGAVSKENQMPSSVRGKDWRPQM